MHGPFMTAFKAPTVNVAGQPNKVIEQYPVLEVLTTHVSQGPMQGDLSITMNLFSAVTAHALLV